MWVTKIVFVKLVTIRKITQSFNYFAPTTDYPLRKGKYHAQLIYLTGLDSTKKLLNWVHSFNFLFWWMDVIQSSRSSASTLFNMIVFNYAITLILFNFVFTSCEASRYNSVWQDFPKKWAKLSKFVNFFGFILNLTKKLTPSLAHFYRCKWSNFEQVI